MNKIIQGDCLIELKNLPDNSVDAIVTDPPYHLTSMTKKREDPITVNGNDGKGNPFCRVQASKGFMGKTWDGGDISYNVELWKECLRVLKPGGYLLSFGGTRTYHRMASAIEDAGFEIRDMIEWVYGCLSEDTEILTPYGWEHYHKYKHLNSLAPILIYDIKNNIYKWEKPKRWSEYTINKDTCYRIKSNTTDQLVSRNHRCLVEREGKLIFVKAEELQEMEFMPTLSNDFLGLEKRQSKILFKEMQWILQRIRVEEVGKDRCNKIQSSREQNEKGKLGREKSSVERWSNLFQNSWKLFGSEICSLSERIYRYGEKGWLCNGTPINNGKASWKNITKSGSYTSQRPQSCKQSDRELNSIQEQQGTQNPRGYGITRAKVTKEEYSGIIFCPTVSTGCFVARRNGKIFITGNSGFPKSLNIGKAVDKIAPRLGQFDEFAKHLTEQIKLSGKSQKEISILFPSKTGGLTGCVWNWANGANVPTVAQWNILKPLLNLSDEFLPLIERIEREREVVGENQNIKGRSLRDIETLNVGAGAGNNTIITKGTSEYEGWGTALKPAHEPICMARKPLSEKSVAENCLKYGTGGINIDESRVETNGEQVDIHHTKGASMFKPGEYEEQDRFKQSIGRFPANLIHDNSEEVRECFPENVKGEIGRAGRNSGGNYNASSYKVGVVTETGFKDNGNASRFFKSIIYQAKASKSERNKGCEDFEEKIDCDRNPECYSADVPFNRSSTPKTNNHPTVKPIALMEYLIKMITPKGGIVLDPFIGSGTTAVACLENGFQFIGIEKEEEYCIIAKARLKPFLEQTKLVGETK